MVPAEELNFDTEKEPWSVYAIEDGSVIKLKQSLVSIFRLTEKHKPDGEPIYVFRIAGLSHADIPPELKSTQGG